MKANLEQELAAYRADLGRQEQVRARHACKEARVGARVRVAGSTHFRSTAWYPTVAARLASASTHCLRAHALPSPAPCQVIRGLERDKQRLAAEATGAADQCRAAGEELAARDTAIRELQRKIAGGRS